MTNAKSADGARCAGTLHRSGSTAIRKTSLADGNKDKRCFTGGTTRENSENHRTHRTSPRPRIAWAPSSASQAREWSDGAPRPGAPSPSAPSPSEAPVPVRARPRPRVLSAPSPSSPSGARPRPRVLLPPSGPAIPAHPSGPPSSPVRSLRTTVLGPPTGPAIPAPLRGYFLSESTLRSNFRRPQPTTLA